MFHHVHFLHESPGVPRSGTSIPWGSRGSRAKLDDESGDGSTESHSRAMPVGPPSWPSMQQQGTLRNPRVTVDLSTTASPGMSVPLSGGPLPRRDVTLVSSRGQVLDHSA